MLNLNTFRFAGRAGGVNHISQVRGADFRWDWLITLIRNQVPRGFQAKDLRVGGRQKTAQRFVSNKKFHSRLVQHILNPAWPK